MKRKFIREYKGWPGRIVEYTTTYDDGSTQKCVCSKDEWTVMETKAQLISDGADAKLLDKFEEAVANIAREDEWMSNAGPEL